MNRERGVRRLAWFVALLGVFAGASSWAQVPRSPGIKVGDGRLHPFLELDGRYDSLVGFFNINQATGQPVPSGEIVLHARPGLRFELLTPSTAINFNGAGEYLWFTGLLSPGSTGLSRFQANVGLDTRFNTDGAVEVQLGDNLVRSDRTQNPVVGVGVMSLFNNLYLAVPIRPGGRALEVTPRVAWGVEFFDPLLTGLVQGCADPNDISCNPLLVSQMNYSNLTFGLNGRWKFLPKTAIVLDANFDWRTYFSSSPANRPAGLLRVQAGLMGLISPRIAVTLLAGYGGDLLALQGPVPVHTFIANAELSYTVTEQTRVAVGYARNVMPVPVLGAAINDRGYVRGGLSFLSGRLTLNGQFALDHFLYMATAARNDFFVSLMAGPSFIVTSWFDVSASYTLGFRTSSTVSPTLNFARHEAMLRLRFQY
jgi:hypothetical protein